jgi:hypothetical protein
MKIALLAALAALALPVVAQQDTKPPEARLTEPRTHPVAAPAPAKTAGKATTPRENARIAKAQNKDVKCAVKEKQPRQKKATAT